MNEGLSIVPCKNASLEVRPHVTTNHRNKSEQGSLKATRKASEWCGRGSTPLSAELDIRGRG